MMNVTVYGTGYVGLVSGLCFAELGHSVICMDINEQKISMLNQGVAPIYEKGLDDLLQRHLSQKNIHFTTDLNTAVSHGQVQMIAVGTPESSDGSVDTSALFSVANAIAERLTHDAIIVVKSTVPVGTGDRIETILQQALQQRDIKLKCSVVSNPEFLQEGTAIDQCLNPDRIVIGTNDCEVIPSLKALYEKPVNAGTPFLTMKRRSAELSKYAANAFLATKISFINEISELAEKMDADITEVRQGMIHDPRINPRFLNPGCGFGGSCFPKDVHGLLHMANEYGIHPHMLDAVLKRNKDQHRTLFEKISHYFNGHLQGKIIALWGLAFKPGTDDIRYASSRSLMDLLFQHGAKVQAYDPIAMPAIAAAYPNHPALILSESPLDAVRNADTLAVVTEWPLFASIDLKAVQQSLKNPIIFDGRLCLSVEKAQAAGLSYWGIGKKQLDEQVASACEVSAF